MFASYCDLSHSAPDDPIIFPRQPGASHLHDFFGNRGTDAYSTDDSLRANLAETCSFQGDTAAYWVPALYENDQRIEPTLLAAYYTAEFKDYTKAEPFPKGLKMVVRDADAYNWWCLGNGATNMYGSVPPRCPEGQHLELEIRFPDCWDGTYLDVPDHRSHMAFSANALCPSSHPVSVVQLKFFVVYERAHGGDVRLAPLTNPSSPHADFVNSWDQEMLTIAVRDCVNAGAFCDGVLF